MQLWTRWLAVGCIGLVVGCGDDSGSGGSGASTATGGNGGSSNGGGGSSNGGGGSSNGGSPSTGGGGSSQGGAGGTSQGGGGSTADGGAGGAGTGGTASNGGGGAGGGPPALVNGCDAATADDHTTEDTVNLTWSFPHQECIRIHAGATVKWNGSFGSHPLVGGVTPTTDASSPITSSDQSGGTASVLFGEIGEYPYFCTAHLGNMQGVVYVE